MLFSEDAIAEPASLNAHEVISFVPVSQCLLRFSCTAMNAHHEIDLFPGRWPQRQGDCCSRDQP
jgi:hypothetical protein